MGVRIRLFDKKHGETVVFDGEPGMELLDYLSLNGSRWGIVDNGKVRMNGVFRYMWSSANHWWVFDQDNDCELLQHMLVPVNPFVSA